MQGGRRCMVKDIIYDSVAHSLLAWPELGKDECLLIADNTKRVFERLLRDPEFLKANGLMQISDSCSGHDFLKDACNYRGRTRICINCGMSESYYTVIKRLR